MFIPYNLLSFQHRQLINSNQEKVSRPIRIAVSFLLKECRYCQQRFPEGPGGNNARSTPFAWW